MCANLAIFWLSISLGPSTPGTDAFTSIDTPVAPTDLDIIKLDPFLGFEHVVTGPDGSTRVASVLNEGEVAGSGERLIYQNVMGTHAAHVPNNQPVSDDISITAPDGCNLTRYRFKVLGKVLPSGTGGPFTVQYGLYSNCPGAVGSTDAERDLVRIPGTEGTVTLSADTEAALIEHTLTSVIPIPTNLYLSLRFSRSNCGTVVGAPAMIGYSGDVWDFPGFPCAGYFGGFPAFPHASIWLEMFGATDCVPAFAGYKAQRPSGSTAFLGANVQGVDDIQLIANDCQMVGYEVIVRGGGVYTFDLRNSCEGDTIFGTERTFVVTPSTVPQLLVARFTFDPPIPLLTQSLYFGFRSNSNASGAVIAGIEPIIGATSSDYFEIRQGVCSPVLPTQGVYGAVNLAITCAESPADCQPNEIPDYQEIAACPPNETGCQDCNQNRIPDFCDIRDNQNSQDCQENQIPDECELVENDCQPNEIPDECEIAIGVEVDCNNNGQPDSCELDQQDCQPNGMIDSCELANGTAQDLDDDGVLDACDGCPNDPDKIVAGECGCGTADIDTDFDTIFDCLDQCAGADDRIDENLNSLPDCLEPGEIPTATSWGLVIFGILLLILAKIAFRNRPPLRRIRTSSG